MKFYEAGVEGVERLGEYHVLRYRWDAEEHSPEPGRFVMARAAGFPATLDPFLARPLSFYDYNGGVASLLFEVRGRGTENLARKKAGETVEVTAPLGRAFDLSELNETSRVALLGGGIGVAPFRFLSRHLARLNVPHDTYLGFADGELAKAADGFDTPTVATMDGSVGFGGTVLDAVAGSGGIEQYGALYACGPNPMLAAVKLAAPPDVRCQLSVEERMGCGNGSCNGCVVPVKHRGYVRSCVEGPVFDAGVLAW
ncbi:dihydroorotate dehydrogenase electron transfer subunit [Rubrobacter indicoceani]|uniref:dihydroorotate dehydrogenase electron transfer subunit n=1 Tax=Rubrobacter indicoceani TaxID=2051957 RepID=UPI000E5B848F|nr:dihydroorotate dehydrogenase electron transfer subunit [Rubrobacter indicoceani]